MSLIIERDSSKFSKHILMLQQRKKLCDADLFVNGEKISVHRVILAASSEYFEQQFVDDGNTEVSLHVADLKSFKNIIEYCYSGKIIVDKSNWRKVLDIANSLIIQEIIKECSRFAEMWINVENCMDTWQFASVKYLPTLEDSAYNFACAYFEKASKTKGFLRLDYERILKLLESDLNVSSEFIVLSSVKRWINEDKPSRSSKTIPLLENVKLAHIPQQELLENFQSLCNIDTRCDRMMLEAIQLQTTTKPIQTNPNTKPRSPHSALIVIGGNAINQSRTVEVFDMKTKTWTAQPEIQFKATDFGCVLHEGKLIVVGGREGNTVTNLVESYDPKTRTLTTMPPLLTARWLHNTVKLGKYVYTLGGKTSTNEGFNTNDIERWDFISNKWESIASSVKIRDRFKAVVLGNEIFCVGGSSNGVNFKDTDAFCPDTGKWRECGKMNVARIAFGLTSFGGYLYAAGGNNAGHINSVEKYDPNIDQWIIFKEFNTARSWLGIGDCWGSLIVIGGYTDRYETKVQIFDEDKQEWTEIGSIKVARSNNLVMQIPWKLL